MKKIGTFDEYQAEARKTRKTSADESYALLGLSGEVGELHSYLAKAVRDGYELDYATVVKELGDILWFVSAIADDFDVSLTDVATVNVNKLHSRAARGTIEGSGDNR